MHGFGVTSFSDGIYQNLGRSQAVFEKRWASGYETENVRRLAWNCTGSSVVPVVEQRNKTHKWVAVTDSSVWLLFSVQQQQNGNDEVIIIREQGYARKKKKK